MSKTDWKNVGGTGMITIGLGFIHPGLVFVLIGSILLVISYIEYDLDGS